MLNLHIVQAEHGDCLILEYGSGSNPEYILIDGGPSGVYETHLKPVLQDIPARQRTLQRVVISHIDDDHINGVLELVKDQQARVKRGQRPTVTIKELWHNTFSTIVDVDVRDLPPDRRAAVRAVHDLSANAIDLDEPDAAPDGDEEEPKSIPQGDELTGEAGRLKLPINLGFRPTRLITVDGAPRPIAEFRPMNMYVVGPSRENLRRLQTDWLKWLARPKAPGREVEAEEVPEPDDSKFNLSSIMLLAESDGKRILLTGDGLGEDLVQGLEQAGVLAAGETLHVDVLKLPHHGSARNVSAEFFRRVTADRYLISANGRDDNPDLLTLKWLVDVAREQGRAIELVITNWTRSICELMRARDPEEYGYEVVAMEPGKHELVLKVAG